MASATFTAWGTEPSSADIDVLEPSDVQLLAAPAASEQDAAIHTVWSTGPSRTGSAASR